MLCAINEANKSNNDIPIGCVITKDNKIISTAHNEKELKNDVSLHAEIVAMKRAGEYFKNWRLIDCDLYVTLEPCPMCAFAILSSGIKNVYFGAYDINYGSFGSKIDMRNLLNRKINVYGGIMEKECEKILVDYFKNIRE